MSIGLWASVSLAWDGRGPTRRLWQHIKSLGLLQTSGTVTKHSMALSFTRGREKQELDSSANAPITRSMFLNPRGVFNPVILVAGCERSNLQSWIVLATEPLRLSWRCRSDQYGDCPLSGHRAKPSQFATSGFSKPHAYNVNIYIYYYPHGNILYKIWGDVFRNQGDSIEKTRFSIKSKGSCI